jgi:hypothetical protein
MDGICSHDAAQWEGFKFLMIILWKMDYLRSLGKDEGEAILTWIIE